MKRDNDVPFCSLCAARRGNENTVGGCCLGCNSPVEQQGEKVGRNALKMFGRLLCQIGEAESIRRRAATIATVSRSPLRGRLMGVALLHSLGLL